MKLNRATLLSVAEDVVLIAGTAVTTWQATSDAGAVVSAVVAAPVAKSLVALLLSRGKTADLTAVRRSKAADSRTNVTA